MAKTNYPLAWILLVILSCVWGASYLLIKKAVLIFSPIEVGLLRMSVATVVLLPFMIRDLRTLTWKDFKLLTLVGICGNLAPSMLFPLAQQKLNSAEAGVLNSLSPVFILIVSAMVFGKRYPWINVVGIVVGMVGATVLILGRGQKLDFDGDAAYALYVVVAAVCYAISANVARQYFNDYPPLRLTSFAIGIIGFPAMLYMFLATDVVATAQTHPQGMQGLVYVGILGALMTAIAVVLFYKMLQVSSLVFASTVTYTQPIVVTTLALIDGEVLGWGHAIGMATILLGVFLVNRK
jgi:drug/metabolite transporter (DMT)-like permease